MATRRAALCKSSMAVKSHPSHIYNLCRLGLCSCLDTSSGSTPFPKANPATPLAAGLLLLVGLLHAYNDRSLLTGRRAQPPPRTNPAARNRHSRLHCRHCKNPIRCSICCHLRLLTTTRMMSGDKTLTPLPDPYRRSPIPLWRRVQRRLHTSPTASDRRFRLRCPSCRSPIRCSIYWVRSLPPPPDWAWASSASATQAANRTTLTNNRDAFCKFIMDPPLQN